MTFDYRASQLRTSKIIASGSTGTNAQLLFYPIAADGTPANQGNINPVTFGTGSIGQDVWFFVSGALGGLDGTSRKVAAFGGDVHISGNLRVGTVLFSTLSSSLYGLSSSYTALSAAFVTLSSSYVGGIGGYDTIMPSVDSFASVGIRPSSSRGDHVHGLPNGIAATDQTVYTGSSWSTTASSPAGSTPSFMDSGSVKIQVIHNDSIGLGYDGTELFIPGLSSKVERPLMASGMTGYKMSLRTRLKSSTGGATNQFGIAGAGFYVRNIDNSAYERIGLTLPNGLAPGNTAVFYGGTGGYNNGTDFGSVVPWDETSWLEIEIENGTTCSLSVVVGSTKTIVNTRSISFQPSHFGVYSLSYRDCSFTVTFDQPQEQLLVIPGGNGLQLLATLSASQARDLLGVGSTDPTWITSGSNYKTTASVAISPDGLYAGAHGTDTYFYVSGSGANKAVFGGTVHFSGTVEADGNFGPIQVGTVTTTNATPAVVWSTTLSDYALQNINLTLIGKQTNNANYAKFNREFTLYKTTGSVAFTDFINAYVPDYQSNGAWGFSLELSGSDLKLYATGSAGVNVFWKSQALINSITSN